MRNLTLTLCATLLTCARVGAIDLNGLQPIAPVVSETKSPAGIIFNCSDRSQVLVAVLAPDLMRVRVSFGNSLPAGDHSWAISKTAWGNVNWDLREEPGQTIMSTRELELIVHHSPLLLEFRDAASHQTINVDERPMMHDPRGTTVAAAKILGFEEHFYGLGEKAAHLDKRRGQFTMWNTDTPDYKEGTEPIYQSIPFYLGWQNGSAYGIFFDNSYRTHFDLGGTSQEYAAFSADGGEMNYYFFYGPSMKKIISRYCELTGYMPLPPLWALGNQQSRWSYYPAGLAEEVVQRYRREDLPLDVLYLDIHYMNGYRDFTWDPRRFPDPKGFTEDLKRQGVKVVTIVDPGIKLQPPESSPEDGSLHPELASQDRNYYVYDEGMARGYFLRHKDGSLYVGRAWPGKCVFVDYTLDAAARWWGSLFRAYTDNGVAGIWTDMNEPSDFSDQTGKTQMDVIFNDEGENSTFAKNRNVFALLMARATFNGLRELRPNERPYVITRAAYAGIQRYSTMWTGDNTSTWESLALSLPMFETLGLSGEAFVGADIGGFMGRCNGELLARWYQVGFLTPFCRNHKQLSGYDQEPWRFGKYYEDIIRRYLKLRYRLLPFLYSTLEESHGTGVPFFRPLLLNYQNDANTLNIDDEFMVGDELLAAPVLGPGITGRLLYLPEGTWFDYWTGKEFQGGSTIYAEAPLDTVPLFVREGSILPMQPEMNYVGEKSADPISFDIYPDSTGSAGTSLYEDDGISPAYLTGTIRRTNVRVSHTGATQQIDLAAPTGTYTPTPRSFVFLVKAAAVPAEVLLDGASLPSISPDAASNGWYKVANGFAVRIADDSRAHRIEIH